jgi:hypothetical protein
MKHTYFVKVRVCKAHTDEYVGIVKSVPYKLNEDTCKKFCEELNDHFTDLQNDESFGIDDIRYLGSEE